MNKKNGAATLYIVVGITIFLIIMTYIFQLTTNLEIDILKNFSVIKDEYKKNASNEAKNDILIKLQEDILMDLDETENMEE